MPPFINLTGQRFGRLTVLHQASDYRNATFWLCQCSCGKQKAIRSYCLRSGATQSCGCLHEEIFNKIITKHGLYGSALYFVWNSMKSRCFTESYADYKHYGGRGIKMSPEWLDFSTFNSWAIQSGYKKGLSIERIDNDGNYEALNCKWIPKSDQAKNTRRTLNNKKD